MKIRGGIIYLFLASAFLLGAVLPKSIDYTPTSLVFTKEQSNQQPNEVTLSAQLKAGDSNKVLPANLQEVIVTNKGNDLLVLINKNIRLPETYEPKDLVSLDGKIAGSGGLQLRKEALGALLKLVSAAKRSGLNMAVVSAYRSYWSQLATYQEKVALMGSEATKNYGARPGHSQHQLGTAVDFQITDLKIVNWLEANSYKYGFALSYPKDKEAITSYAYEPWHYRYVGGQNAITMKNFGMILEEYLQEFGVW